MKRAIIILFLCLTVLFSNSCEKVIAVETINSPRKLVVNGANQADSTWHVHISHSASLTDSLTPNAIENALVQLTNDNTGQSNSLFHQENGHYTSSQNPIAGHQYSIEVLGEDFETVKAKTVIPSRPKLDSIKANWGVYLNDSVLIVDLWLTDFVGVNNFYLVNAIAKTTSSSGEEEQVLELYTLDKNADNGDLGDEATALPYLYLNDTAFPNQRYSTRFYLDINNHLLPTDSFCLNISLFSLSEGLFLHLKSYQQYLDDNINVDFDLPLQIQVYSNVENGFGIFGGFAKQKLEECY